MAGCFPSAMCVFAAVGLDYLITHSLKSSATVVWLLYRVALFPCIQLPVLYPVPSFAITLLAGSLGGQ